jgi:hypothetical protein
MTVGCNHSDWLHLSAAPDLYICSLPDEAPNVIPLKAPTSSRHKILRPFSTHPELSGKCDVLRGQRPEQSDIPEGEFALDTGASPGTSAALVLTLRRAQEAAHNASVCVEMLGCTNTHAHAQACLHVSGMKNSCTCINVALSRVCTAD